MIIFLDTSAWVKFFIEEQGTDEIQAFLFEKSQASGNIFATSAVTYAEIYATFARALKGRRIGETAFLQIKKEFELQWRNVDVPIVDKTLVESSGRIAEKYGLKGCDAFQLASALAMRATIFINSDKELATAAKDSHLIAWNPAKGKLVV